MGLTTEAIVSRAAPFAECGVDIVSLTSVHVRRRAGPAVPGPRCVIRLLPRPYPFHPERDVTGSDPARARRGMPRDDGVPPMRRPYVSLVCRSEALR
jgi:hypothetical protein